MVLPAVLPGRAECSGCPGGPCTHTPHLKGASYRGNALLSRLEWAVVHFERGRPGDRRVAVSSLASLAHGQLDEKEPFLTVHEPETESSFTHTGNISVLNNKSTVPFIGLGLKKGQDGVLESNPAGLGWRRWPQPPSPQCLLTDCHTGQGLHQEQASTRVGGARS